MTRNTRHVCIELEVHNDVDLSAVLEQAQEFAAALQEATEDLYEDEEGGPERYEETLARIVETVSVQERP